MIASLPVVMIMSLQRLRVRSNVRGSHVTAITPQITQPDSPSDLQPVTITSKVTQLSNPLDVCLTVNKDRAENGMELKEADAKDGGPELITERVSTDWEGAMGAGSETTSDEQVFLGTSAVLALSTWRYIGRRKISQVHISRQS